MNGRALADARHVLQSLHLDLQRLAKQEHAMSSRPEDGATHVSLAAVIDLLRVAVGDLVTILSRQERAALAPTFFYLNGDAQAILDRLVEQISDGNLLALVIEHYTSDLRHAGSSALTGFVRVIRRQARELDGIADDLAAWHERERAAAVPAVEPIQRPVPGVEAR